MPAVPSDISANISWPVEATDRMNRMYRRQRHIYDGTRRYYLLGRDQMIAGLQPSPGANILEIGCGTGRNLVLAAGLYRNARFFGVDVSTEMLTSAITAISRRGLAPQILVAHGDATAFDPQLLFGVPCFDHIMISYSLSMIPNWSKVLEAAIGHLKPGGRLHIVDFGKQERLPGMARALLLRWLALFDVTPRDDLERVLSRAGGACGADLKFERPFRGYAQYAVLTLPLTPSGPK
ncbi:class I SAM-dependent methyltransferase [Bradyrhizobium canariense]|uniref:S-adenosylmethionine-diacylgycerolhomoserine-N-methlytransferase n=1 Tax=Bradyrhizobium canariense TaxID=255045 RepID=A0A1H1X302_9BRAD|nr:class I SAM-dependent methyltransferase [Bradyrhizobium canariense]SDT03724.1 S-adenosylmethionine-diacylgycerolhomoserine-N-methlytransferase [Bradyrhizobium canariense]